MNLRHTRARALGSPRLGRHPWLDQFKLIPKVLAPCPRERTVPLEDVNTLLLTDKGALNVAVGACTLSPGTTSFILQ